MKRRTCAVKSANRWWGAGAALLVSFTASAGFGPVCDNCQLPSASPIAALGLESQIPGLAAVDASGTLGKPFGSFLPSTGLIPAQSALSFPNLWNLSGGSTPPPTPSWMERVNAEYLPSGFSLAPKPLVDPDSIVWNWGPSSAQPGLLHPYLAMNSLWNGPSAPWYQAAQFWSGVGMSPIPQGVIPQASPQLAIAAGTAR